ncbi:hypothetical protein [Urbifossiella limnaea]|uniref:Uncharacterized protein n=1 Tax=Urbifossiella limnaea TaxID=2528023 RepID=A0A517XQS0_9BACT|nr:hypothetical protein [Urbifossiella limnaea]QDU19854.1 hypothetical protein ETAA1_17920 [Urbifossiella limnaea]
MGVASELNDVPIASVERIRLRSGVVTIATLGVSYLHAMQLPWPRTVLVLPGGERRPVAAELGFVAPLDAPAVVTLALDAEVVLPGSRLSFVP